MVKNKSKQEGKKKKASKSVPYHGQRPHCQGKRPGPLVCFSFNIRNAFRRAFPSLKHQNDESCKKSKSRIECLMEFLEFDINQLLIYENQKKSKKKQPLINHLRIMKCKVEELKTTSLANKCVMRAEEMLKRKAHLKCTSRGLRKGLIEFMANVEQTERRSKIVCDIMTQLDAMDMDIAELCKSVKDMPIALNCDIQTPADYSTAGMKRNDCGDIRNVPPEICEEVMRPYDPATDEDSTSIHLRYVPALDSFKADMARNPCALRLPLMCPSMKRIMNKMKVKYLMDDVPISLKPEDSKYTSEQCPIISYVNVPPKCIEDKQELTENIERRSTTFCPPMWCGKRNLRLNGKEIRVFSFKDLIKLWFPTVKQI